MTDLFLITLSQIAVLFVFIIVGYLLRRFNILPDNSATVISKLIMWVFLTSMAFKTFAVNFTIQNLSENMGYLAAGIACAAVMFLIGNILGEKFGKIPVTKAIYKYSFVVPNTGYMGYPIITGLFGELALCHFMVFAIPLLVITYTWGVAVLTGGGKISAKSLKNPMLIGMLLGIVFGLIGIPVPELPMTILTNAANCMAPCAMILAGIVVAKKPLAKAFSHPRAYFASLIRLIAIPAVIMIAFKLLNVNKDIMTIGTLAYAMPMGMNTIVFPEANGMDSSAGSSTVIISHAMSVLTIPMFVAILSAL